MGWRIGYDTHWQRDIGYGVPAQCDYPDCDKEIDRGLSYVCGGEPHGGEEGCGLYFCSNHLYYSSKAVHQLCERCLDGEEPFEPSEDIEKWIQHKLIHESWTEWRME